VPFYFDPTLLHVGAWTNVNPFRARGTVKTIVGTDTFHGATIAAFTVARAAEAAAATEGNGAVGQISAIVGKVHGAGRLSAELLQDRPDITSELAALIAEAKDTEEESSFAVGVGDALGAGFNPIGVLAAGATSGAYTSLTTATATTLAATDADLVEAALPIRHRAGAEWFMSRAAIRQWEALETTSGKLFGGQYYQRTPNPSNNAVGNTNMALLGYPINEVPSGLSGVGAATIIGALINPKSFYIIERAGMSVEVIQNFLDPTTGYPTGERLIYAWWRNTAKPADVNAGRRLAIHS
jgi:HK97 family phage major capsid protein